MSAYSAFPNNTETIQGRYERGPYFPALEYDLPVLIPPYSHVQVYIAETRVLNDEFFHMSAWHPGIVQCVVYNSYYLSYTDCFNDNVYYVYVKIIDAFRLLRNEPDALRDARVAAERAALITTDADRNVGVLAIKSTPTLPCFVYLGAKVRAQTDFSDGDFVTATVVKISKKYIYLELNSIDYRHPRGPIAIRLDDASQFQPPDDNE